MSSLPKGHLMKHAHTNNLIVIEREKLLAEITKRITEISQSILIIGPHGSGKTTLLTSLQNILGLNREFRKFDVAYIDTKRFSIEENYTEKFWIEILSILNIKPANINKDTFDALSEIEGYSKEKNKKIILLLDNIDLYLRSAVSSDLRKIKLLADSELKNNVLFVATCADYPDKIIEKNKKLDLYESPFYNCYVSYLRLFDLNQTKNYLESVKISPKNAEYIYEITGGYPEFLRIVTEEIEKNYGLDGNPLDSASMQNIYQNMLIDDRIIWLCRSIYNDLSASQKRVIDQIILNSDSSLDEEYSLVIRKLRDHFGLLREANGEWRIFGSIFSTIIQNDLINKDLDEEPQKNNIPDETDGFDLSKPLTPALDFLYNKDNKTIVVNGKSIEFSNLENRLFSFLLENKNKLCTHDQLLENVWSKERSPKVVERGINRLRIKIENDPSMPEYILNYKGKGYKLNIK